jgi:hypothetical protein
VQIVFSLFLLFLAPQSLAGNVTETHAHTSEIAKEQSTSRTNKKSQIDDDKQAARKSLIFDATILERVIKRIEFPNDKMAYMLVTSEFHSMSFEKKQNYCLTVLQYYKIDGVAPIKRDRMRLVIGYG